MRDLPGVTELKPLARKNRFLVRKLANEVVVYDLDHHEAHCLNPSAALVFERSDGHTSVGEMARRLHADLGLPEDENLVWLALQRLEGARLLEECPLPPPTLSRWSRREAVRRIGLGVAVLLPAVQSILAPTPAEAATCLTPGSCAGGGEACTDNLLFGCAGGCRCQGSCSSGCCSAFGNPICPTGPFTCDCLDGS